MCLLHAGFVDARYVAVLPIHELTKRHRQRRRQNSTAPQRGAGASRASKRDSSSEGSDSERGNGSSPGGSDSEEERFQRRDSLARGPDVRAVGGRSSRGALDRSDTLTQTIDRVLERAERILGTAG